MDQSAWSCVLSHLTRNYCIMLYGLVCAGSVNPDHFDFSHYDNLDDLLDILDMLCIPRCVFIGHSISTIIDILASIRRPRPLR
uniref:AB hydrolase-1 domain-containing protein n=1 Tax=Oryza nivara TaxID=4536 RepID=A0A0E0FJX0_ORYNI